MRIRSWMPGVSKPSPVAVELCAGMGAIGIGLRSLGFRVVQAYDSWREAVSIYNHNAPERVARLCDPLTEEGHRKVVKEARALGNIDLLVAGPPCQGFSQLGNGQRRARSPHNRVLNMAALLSPCPSSSLASASV